MKYEVILTITDDPKISTHKAGDCVFRSKSFEAASKRAANWSRLGATVKEIEGV